MPEHPRRLRVLTWHVHGNYLYYLSQAPHDFVVVTREGVPGYAGLGGALPWGPNLRAVPHDALADETFDCVLYQARDPYLEHQHQLLTPRQRALPRIYVEHDPPQGHPTNTVHPFQEPDGLLVHVSHFNALMWDSGVTPAMVIEHGVVVPPQARYTGEYARGVTVVNHLAQRGRRLGADVFAQIREQVAVDLVGMAAEESGGIGEIANPDLPAFMARYRYFFNPIRYTSMPLSVVEAMHVGLPIVALATTELASVIVNERQGYIDTRLDRLVDVMRTLAENPALARTWGDAARELAQSRFGIERFAADWDRALRRAVGDAA